MDVIFTPCNFGNLKLRNRIAMAPMTRRMAKEGGIPTQQIIDYYKRRALGEVGLIISEGTGIDSVHAYDTLTVPRFDNEEQLQGWKKVVEAIHEAESAFAPQLWHTGRFAANPIGPSYCEMPARKDGSPRPPVKAMEKKDFIQVKANYVRAALNAQKIQCDAIEIHGAHGYLLDSFLSAKVNKRKDEYGGSLENRMRFPLEVTKAIREAVGKDYPIIYRFSQWRVDDYSDIKFHNPKELELWVKALAEAGADILHVSTYDAMLPGFPEHGNKTFCGWAKELSGLPCIAVGKITVNLTLDKAYGDYQEQVTDPKPALDLVTKGEADMLAIGRALIPNPDWVKIVREGNWKQLQAFDKSQLENLV